MYFFRELSYDAQKKAVADYKNGWAETHPENIITDAEAKNVLTTYKADDLYEKDGTLIVDDDVVSEHDYPYIVKE